MSKTPTHHLETIWPAPGRKVKHFGVFPCESFGQDVSIRPFATSQMETLRPDLVTFSHRGLSRASGAYALRKFAQKGVQGRGTLGFLPNPFAGGVFDGFSRAVVPPERGARHVC